jgi:hypothetical protein
MDSIKRFIATPFLLMAAFGSTWALKTAGRIMFDEPILLKEDGTNEEI